MMHDALLVALVCGLCSLDATAVLQMMFSRPLVVGTLCGLVLHDPQAGFATACIIELLWLGNLPVGSAVPPDFTLAAGLASGASILVHRMLAPQISWEACGTLMLLFALPIAWVGGWSDLWQRRKSAALASWVERRLDEGDESALNKAIVLSVAVGFARSFALAFVGMLLLLPVAGFVLRTMPLAMICAFEWMYWLSLLLGFVVLLDQFWERRWLKVLCISFVVSAVAAYGLHLKGSLLFATAVGVGGILAVVNEWRLRGREAKA